MTTDAPRPDKTAVVLVVPHEDAEKRLHRLTRIAEPGLKRCRLFVVLTGLEPGEAAARREALTEHLREWAYWNILAPLELSSSESDSKQPPRHAVLKLTDYLCTQLVPRVIRTSAKNPVLFVWNGADAVLAAAVTAAIAAYDDVKWIDPPQPGWLARPRELVLASRHAPSPLRAAASGDGPIGESSAMNQVRRLLRTYAPLPFPVLLAGETGTGKEECAKALHRWSGRLGKRASQNAAMLDPARSGSELFGHVKGAFTGAIRDFPGRIKEAEGGTFFLDELDSLPPPVQGQLLRAAQDADKGTLRVEPLGAPESSFKDIHARLVAAIQPCAIDEDRVRPDLLYRIDRLRVSLPPLRQRGDDVLLLAEHFVRGLHEQLGSGPTSIRPGAKKLLSGAAWPGNVRQLQTTVWRAFLLAREDGTQSIGTRHLPPGEELSPPHDSAGADSPLKQQVARLVVTACDYALARHPNNKTAAARELGLSSGQDLERYKALHNKELKARRTR